MNKRDARIRFLALVTYCFSLRMLMELQANSALKFLQYQGNSIH